MRRPPLQWAAMPLHVLIMLRVALLVRELITSRP
jgi:hypothetical protein